MRLAGTLIALLAAATLLRGQATKEVAVTLDDLPFGYGQTLTITERRDAVARILAALDKHRVTATVFVIGQAITDQNRGLVDAVARAGHVVGNHSFSHRDLGAVASEDYILDIQKGEEAINPWRTGARYFRYPLLRQGNTVEKRDAVLNWLGWHGIIVAPVTIDNDDFVYNQRLVDAKAAGRTLDVREEYLSHMMEAVVQYDAKARTLMGRPIKQVLLLHMNYLNSLYLDELLQRLRDNGWSFITLEDALKDDVYKLKYDHVGVRGAGHLDAIKPSAK